MKIYLLYALLILFLFNCSKEDPAPAGPVQVPIEELVAKMEYDTIALLSGILRLQTPAPVTAEVQIGSGQTITVTSESDSLQHELPILGLYPGRENLLIVRVEDEINNKYAIDTIHFAAPPLPEYLPEIRIDVMDAARMEPGWTLCEFNLGSEKEFQTIPLAFDPAGNIRWLVNLDWTGRWAAPFEPLQNGHFLLGHNWGLFEYDRVGRQVRHWSISGYSQHHDAIEKPDGNFLIPVSKHNAGTSLDFIVEVDRQSSEVVREWDLRQVLDVDRNDLIHTPWDWLHVNSVWFDERDEGLVISGRHQGVFKVSKDNDLQWILAPHQGWGQAGPDGQGIQTADYLLTAVDAGGQPYPEAVQQGLEGRPDFRWPWGQHAAMVLPDGHILLFDNGWNRHFKNDEKDFSRVVIYEVNAEHKTVRQVWQYGEERGPELYSVNISDADLLTKTGNILMTSGNIMHNGDNYTKIVEVTYPDGEVVFEATVRFKNTYSVGTGWTDADIVYRGERVDFVH
jgi:arylsulfate sulfotransferase